MTSISSLIAPALDEYVQLVAFEFKDKPYVFCTRDATRCQTSSAWSSYCKGIFKKWSGMACPPKMLVSSPASHPCARAACHVGLAHSHRIHIAFPSLTHGLSVRIVQRASFVTWIRSTEASPDVLKQAARAMRHQKATADSDSTIPRF